ncbi:hypothetical protein LCGC14_1429280 [marine sediment metagenome]|uniref:Uncharacterized protein n=1 Tax=marine sediment metagenome TaxID=412755 RepID=A0A0F9JP44_9ZZZZ
MPSTRQINYRMTEREIYDPRPGSSLPLGARGYSPNGRIFRMARASTVALTVGQLVRKPENEIRYADMSVATAVGAGNTKFTLTMNGPTIALDDYRDGTVYFNDGPNQGHSYAIVGNSLTAANGTLTIDINTGLTIALTTSSKATIIKNRYDGVRVTEPSPVERTLGVVPVAVTASYYFWLQTGGPAIILQDGNLFENRDVIPSQRIRGATQSAGSAIVSDTVIMDALGNEKLTNVPAPAGAVPSNAFGYVLDPRVNTDYALVQVELD